MIIMKVSYVLSRVIVFQWFVPLLEYVIFYILFPGGIAYATFAYIYIHFFDTFCRQKVPKEIEAKNEVKDWSNPEVVGRNRRPMHHKSRSFFKKSDAKTYWNEKTEGFLVGTVGKDQILLLTGPAGTPENSRPWRFLLVGSPEQCPNGWETPGFNDRSMEDKNKAWDDVQLPNHWQLQGYDIPLYTNTTYPFRFDPPFAVRDGTWTNCLCDLGLGAPTINNHPLHPKEPGENTTGLFRLQFKTPSLWSGPKDDKRPRVFLVFEGVDSCFSVWMNGTFVGYSQDCCMCSEFDVTEVLSKQPEQECHTLAVMVSRWCDGSYLEDQDKWWLSGIYREVYLIRKPSTFISDLEITPIVHLNSSEECFATVTVNALLEGVSPRTLQSDAESQVNVVRVELYEDINAEAVTVGIAEVEVGDKLAGRLAADTVFESDSADVNLVALNKPGTASLMLRLDNPKLWSAEDPTLYIAVVTLFHSLEEAADIEQRNEGIHTETHRFGLRNIRIGGHDNVLTINDKPVTIGGVNRHEFDPFTGRAVSKENMRNDVLLLKSLNFNAVRCAHYPNHPYFYDVCDELGMYVIDEANIETHGFQTLGQPVGYLAHRLEWRSAMATRVTRMYERDKNHVSIIAFSLGNESGHGPTHDLMANWLRARDSTRFVHYESGGARTAATDVICPMYQRPTWCLEQSKTDSKQRPVILCEYAHAMGKKISFKEEVFGLPSFSLDSGRRHGSQ